MTVNEEFETLRGRFTALQACVTVIVATLPKAQVRECATLLREQLADPSINDYARQLSGAARQALERDLTDMLKLMALAE